MAAVALRFGGPDRRKDLQCLRGFHGRELQVLGVPLPCLECHWPVHGEQMDVKTRGAYVAKHCQTKGAGTAPGQRPVKGRARGAGPGGGPGRRRGGP